MDNPKLDEIAEDGISEESKSLEEIDYSNYTNWNLSVKEEIKFFNKL